MLIGAVGVGRALVVWGLVALVVLAVVGLWAITGETRCHPPAGVASGHASPPAVTLPSESEVAPSEGSPGIALTY